MAIPVIEDFEFTTMGAVSSATITLTAPTGILTEEIIKWQ
jgi:hypothetical protein